MPSDSELLRQFAGTHSEDAFAEVVRRHVNLVYSAALRRVGGDSHLAQDVSQTVFTDLAGKANSLSRRESLTGWLYTSAHFAAAKIVRTENRRREREERFMREPGNDPAPEDDWEKIHPVLEEAMHELKPLDREAILLRHFENQPFSEVGAKLGLNENAARMRVERALEKLRALLAKRGLATPAALASIISANAVQVAPMHLAATLTAASITGAKTGATLTVLKILMTTKLKLGLGAAAALGAASVLLVQHQSEGKLRLENETLRQQVTHLQADYESLSSRAAPDGAAAALPPDQLGELLRLRGEVGVLRRQTNELGKSLANTRTVQPPRQNAVAEPQALSEDYPKTADAATKSIFETWKRGDMNAFFTNFAEPGVPREMYEKMFNNPKASNYLASMEVVEIGQPTNSFGPNMYFVPYKLRFPDGTEKEWQLHVAQDPRTQRWYFKGGL